MFKKFLSAISSLVSSLIIYIPGPLGIKIRYFYYKKKFRKCGKNVRIDVGVILENPEWISIGDNVWIDKYSILMAGPLSIPDDKIKYRSNSNIFLNKGELYIGSNSHIGIQTVIQAHGGVYIGDYFTSSAGCRIYSLSNDITRCKYGTFSDKERFFILSPILIGKNVWLGLNVIVLGGKVGDDSFVAPNSVVLYDIPENSFASGNPAKKIKDRFKIQGEFS